MVCAWHGSGARAGEAAGVERGRGPSPRGQHGFVALLPELRRLPVVLTHHNVESTLLKQRAERARNPATAYYLGFQASLLRRAEQEWLSLVAANVAVSDKDAAEFRQIAPGARVEVVPNGVDTDYFHPKVGPTAGCVFVGGTSWYPNLDGLEWFVAEILPRLRGRGMTEEVTWVGRATGAELITTTRSLDCG